tara:strand:- start:149109 stop:149252 length:144 start_codon:yes stop_codon:yes gene_type:complete
MSLFSVISEPPDDSIWLEITLIATKLTPNRHACVTRALYWLRVTGGR